MNRIANVDPKVAEMVAECEKFGIIHDCNERWEKGVEHHPKAVEIFEILKDSDWAFGNDYFEWKYGGDGDNGEILMYSLSVLLELRDAQNKEAASD